MTDEFKKARDKAFNDCDAMFVDSETAWQGGADWAYEWLMKDDLTYYERASLYADKQILQAKADKLAEALETLKVAAYKADDPGATAFIERVLAEYRGEK